MMRTSSRKISKKGISRSGALMCCKHLLQFTFKATAVVALLSAHTEEALYKCRVTLHCNKVEVA